MANFYCVSPGTIFKRLKKANLKSSGCNYYSSGINVNSILTPNYNYLILTFNAITVNMDPLDRRDYRRQIRNEMAELLDDWSQHRVAEQLDMISLIKQTHLQELIQMQQQLTYNNPQQQEEQQLASPSPPPSHEPISPQPTIFEPLDYSSGYQHFPSYENHLAPFGSFFMNPVPEQSSTVIQPMNY